LHETGLADTARVDIILPPPPLLGEEADPSQLPLAAGQGPEPGYTYGRKLEAGKGYMDPVTGVGIYKVTDATTPFPNREAGHDYSGGGPFISLPWAQGGKAYYTIFLHVGRGRWYFVDFNYSDRTFENWREAPAEELGLAFSLNENTPRIAYYLDGSGVLHRYDTETMTQANTGHFPHQASNIHDDGTWFHNSLNDEMFVWQEYPEGNGVVWDAVNDVERYTWSSADDVNEPALDRSGNYLFLSVPGTRFQIVRLSDGVVLGAPDGDRRVVHPSPGTGGLVFTHDPDTGGGYQFYVAQGNGQVSTVGRPGDYFGAPGLGHHSALWVTEDNATGLDQWTLFSSYTRSGTNPGLLGNNIAFLRASDGETRILAWHDSVSPDYWEVPMGQLSPDGRLVIFKSNMNGSSRYDTFLALVPTR